MSKKNSDRQKIYDIYNLNFQSVIKAMGCQVCEVDGEKITNTTDGYICPICIRIFSKQDLEQDRQNPLTLEHIEPDAIGGNKLVLTCKECNNNAGILIDKHLKAHTDLKAENKTDVLFKIENFNLKGKMIFNPKENLVENIIGKNNDYIKRKLDEFFTKEGEKKMDFKIKINDKFKLKCGLLKAAHLKMFYFFGYGYLMNKSIYKIANQINNPDKKIIELPEFIELPDYLPDDEDIFFSQINNEKFFLIKINLRGRNKTLKYGVIIPGPKEEDLLLYQKVKDFDNKKFSATCIETSKINYLDNPYSFYDFFIN